MSILVDRNTKVITQGMTGETGTFHTAAGARLRHADGRRRDAGQGRHRRISACRCSTPSHEAVAKTGATRRVIYVPPPFAADSILEAIDAEVPLIVAITEGIPVLDMVKVKRALSRLEVAADRPELPGRADARTSARSASCPATSSRRAASASSAARAR